MKVTIDKEIKYGLTLGELAAARRMIKGEREADSTVEEYAQMAVRCVARTKGEGNWNFEIFNATAKIGNNPRVEYDYFGDDTKHLDIYIGFYAFNMFVGFYRIGAWLSDIYNITSTDEAWDAKISGRMWVTEYKKVESAQ